MSRRFLAVLMLCSVISTAMAENWFSRIFSQLGEKDTTYIEPQHYPFTVMLQNSNVFDRVSVDDDETKMVFAPDMSHELGPFFGYRWIFLGATFDVQHLFKSKDRTNIALAIYTNPFTIDLFYRRAGNDFTVRKATSSAPGSEILSQMEGMECTAIQTKNVGLDISYVLNHKHYSMPAAFAQSTNQRRSAGSFIFGLGYMRSKFDFNSSQLIFDFLDKIYGSNSSGDVILSAEQTRGGNEDEEIDDKETATSTYAIRDARYNSIALQGGYGYNWVFAHNWTLGAVLSLKPSLKTCNSNLEEIDYFYNGDKQSKVVDTYKRTKLNVDYTARLGVVYNNTKWYCGASAIFYENHYDVHDYDMCNFFGSINIYAGINLGKRE